MQPKQLVVAIGASSGGLAGLKDFFSQPEAAALGAAYLVCVHYHPDAESHLDELLGTSSGLTPVMIKRETALTPGTIHILPPGQGVRFSGKGVAPAPLSGSEAFHHVIDSLFAGLAEQAREAAVAVVLSGALNDGSAGIIAIKEKGGLVIAQDPSEAGFPDMPQSAINTGTVDMILPAARIPGAIKNFHDNLVSLTAGEAGGLSESPTTLAGVLEILKAHTGQDFTDYKTTTVDRRIKRRMGLLGVNALKDYESIIARDHDERKKLLRDLLINVTGFFRDPQTWIDLKTKVLIPMLSEAEAATPFRAWVAGCATGQEAYTLAMLLSESFEEAGKRPVFQVFATDIEEHSLAKARSGVFDRASVASLDKIRLNRFFIPKGGAYVVSEDLREKILFARHNVFSDPPFSKLNLVSCRNLLIYFSVPLQERVLRVFHFALKQNGLLLLGSSESLGSQEGLFKLVTSFPKCFRKSESFQLLPDSFTISRFLGGTASGRGGENRSQDKVQVMNNLLLNRFVPPLLIVNNKFEVVHFSGAIGKYLDFPSGPPTTNLVDLLRDGLRVRVQNTIRKSLKQETRAEAAKVRYVRDGEHHYVRCLAEYIAEPGPIEGMVLVHFEDLPDRPGDDQSMARDEMEGYGTISQLEEELKTTKEELRLSIMDLESSLGELRTANEELISTNEEYQSANEELVTAKEECQSLNEELNSVNSELHEKVLELEKVTSDLRNFIESSRVPTIFLDREFKLRRFTPAMSEIVSIRQADIGRHIRSIPALEWDGSLAEDVARVFGGLEIVQGECETPEGRWYLRRVLPYVGHDQAVEGIVVTYADITDIKLVTADLASVKDLLEAVVEQSPVPMAVATLKQEMPAIVNSAFIELTGADRASITDLESLLMSYTPLRPDGTAYALEERCLPLAAFGVVKRIEEVKIARPGGGESWAMLICSPITDAGGKTIAAMVALPDITIVKEAELSLLAAKEAAETANRTKSEFLANMSHEIRTPLNGVAMTLQLIQMSELNEEQRWYCRCAIDSCFRLNGLLADILDLSVIESGKLNIREEEFDVNDLMRSVIDHFTVQAKLKSLFLEVFVSKDIPDVLVGDMARLRQVLFNLLGNAVKFTDKGTVILEAHLMPHAQNGMRRILFVVSDTGIGISDTLLPRIFEPFTQGDHVYTKRFQGAGLGLSIVRKLVVLMGGELAIDSLENKGTAVYLSLPLKLPGSGQISEKPETREEARVIPSSLRILIADDDKVSLTTMERMLEKLGHAAAIVTNGQEALMMLDRQDFDLILMDIQMPVMDGVLATQKIREGAAGEGYRAIPIIAMTAYSMSGDREKFLAAGMDGYISKPVDMAELDAAIQQAMMNKI